MKTKISVYWPVAVVLTLAVMAAVQGYGERGQHSSHTPLAAAQVSAELARAVSYGLVGTQPVRASSSVSAVRDTEPSQAL
jgi:hypothetical protein